MENTIMAKEQFWVTPADKFERNDIAVFDCYDNDYMSPIENEPEKWEKKWQARVYRIVAYSGDSVEIREGELYVNGKKILPPASSKTVYEIRFRPGSNPPMDEQEIAEAFVVGTNIIQAILTSQRADELSKNPATISIEKKVLPVRTDDTSCARSSNKDNWSVDYYGPLRIPAPGETITVTTENYRLYQHIPDIGIGQFTIKEKLYFLLGDNRHSAMDSRFIGLISHSRMKGIVKKK